MAAGAANEFFRSLYESCISGSDIIIERQPYLRNCHCALHDKALRNCPHASPKSKSVSYPIRRAWSEESMAMEAAASSCHSSSSLSSAWGGKNRLGPCKEEEEDVLGENW
ncbi:Zinc finger protein, putative isoform 1 [Hibiscus syriacus]|uniref:Zinc finger protein, putative isoform 1 n=1 Tax=Hibiscus syriacus TaxID=106335 RepID=A0A6A2XT20_HIBSY|nr:Zinc finger protein, putative isoform 1 [Hibiscus syriacus]